MQCYVGIIYFRQSIMAHCVHVTDADLAVLREAGTSVAHCPTSNICHERGLCPVRKIMSVGIKLGLGTSTWWKTSWKNYICNMMCWVTDVSAAFSTSMLQAMRHAILTSKIIRISNFSNKPLSYEDSFYLATLGGAEGKTKRKSNNILKQL